MNMKYKILIVDDEKEISSICVATLKCKDHDVYSAENGQEAVSKITELKPDLLITDVKMPGMSGMELLKWTKKNSPETCVMLITGYSTVNDAVEAMRLGAIDYITKPFLADELRIKTLKVLETRKLILENIQLKKELSGRLAFGEIMGRCVLMQKIFDLVEKVAPTDATVLIYGESGTGKELVANAIHHNSRRRDKPFVSVDCASLSETLLESELFGHIKGSFTGAVVTKQGLFETAHGGTLFMDEIGDISPAVQAKLLRVMQEKKFRPVGATEEKSVDIRLVAATNKDLEQMVAEGAFREDLFYRLNIIQIRLPPLRERKEDIPLFIKNFLIRYGKDSKVKSFSIETMKLLAGYAWPGNVRELENFIERIVITANEEVVTPFHLSGEFSEGVQISCETPKNAAELKMLKKDLRKRAVIEAERLFINDALRRNNGNVAKAASEAGMKRQNFHSMMRRSGAIITE